MYLSHYGLQKKPFDISPDPSFLWLGEKHREALSYLKYGIMENKGFLMITGDVGTGKTALIKRLTRLIEAATFVVTIPDPDMDKLDFFNFLADELGMDRTFKSKGEFLIHFKHFLRDAYSDHRKVLLIIDESQRLNHELLQEIRLLSNIDLGGQVLLNIFFVGQTEFNMILKEERNRTVRQRITASFHLDPLNLDEVKNYIVHRLRIAGASSQIFSDEAIERVYRHTNGYPRLINILCDHALMTGYSSGATAILPGVVDECAGDLSITFASRAGAASEAAFDPEPILGRDLESAVLAEPVPAFDPTPAATSEAVVKQMALAAGERRKSILRPFALALAILLVLAGMTYFAYRPVSDYVASLRQTQMDTPPLIPSTSIDPQASNSTDSPSQDQRVAAAQDQRSAAGMPVTTEVPSAFKASADTEKGGSADLPAAGEVQNRSQYQGSAAMLQKDGGAASPTVSSAPKSVPAAVSDDVDADGVAAPGEPEKPVVSALIEKPLPAEQTGARSGGSGDDQPAPPTANAGSGQAIVSEPQRAVIYFEHDSHDLPPLAAAELARLADAAMRSAIAEIAVQGYTDSLGNEWYNRKLSQTRADIVRDFFVDRGVDPKKVKAFGLGSEFPLASNREAEGRRKNRRVEIYFRLQ